MTKPKTQDRAEKKIQEYQKNSKPKLQWHVTMTVPSANNPTELVEVAMNAHHILDLLAMLLEEHRLSISWAHMIDLANHCDDVTPCLGDGKLVLFLPEDAECPEWDEESDGDCPHCP